MDRRLLLSDILRDILGSTEVYYQPKRNIEMAYPAITYEQSAADTKFANNKPYTHMRRYTVTLISRDPEHPAYPKLAALPRCLFDRHFVADDLNHDVFNIYF